MATFFNQATLSFRGSVVNSNTTEAELLSGLELTKTPITNSYSAGGGVVYTITLRNLGTTAYNGITLTDDLGAYTAPGGATAVPLDYVDGSLLYFVNGIPTPPPTVTTDTGALVLSGINIPAGGNATIIYEAQTNSFAPLAVGETVTNTVTVTGGGLADNVTANETVSVRNEPYLSITKALCPLTVTDNGEIVYTFVISNSGNTAAVATDNVTVTDLFDPIISISSVTLDGVPLLPTTQYVYNETTGLFETVPGVITVPAATYTQNPDGSYTVVPGSTTLTVTGII